MSGSQEVVADAQGSQRASTQRYEGQKGDDETVAIPKCIHFADGVCCLCTIHELYTQRIELIAGQEMKSPRFG